MTEDSIVTSDTILNSNQSARPTEEEAIDIYLTSADDEKLYASSSTLSEGLCLSLLGKPCTNKKQKIPSNSDLNREKIGNLFGTDQKTEKPFRATNTVKLNSKRKENSAIGRPTNLDVAQENDRIKNNSLNNSKVVKEEIGPSIPTTLKENLENTKDLESKPTVVNDNAITGDLSVSTIDGTNTKRTSTEISKKSDEIKFDIPTKDDNKNIELLNNNKSELQNGKQQLLKDITGGNKENGFSEDFRTSSKDIAQQTIKPSILKPPATSTKMLEDFDPFETALTVKSHQPICKGREKPCMEAEREYSYRRPHERKRVTLTSDKILQTSDNNLLQFPCSCPEDTSDSNEITPREDSAESPYDSTVRTTPKETSSSLCYCCNCHSPLRSKDYHPRNIPRYRLKKSVKSPRSKSPPSRILKSTHRKQTGSNWSPNRYKTSRDRKDLRLSPVNRILQDRSQENKLSVYDDDR